jgi:hypothetical protein
MKDGASIMADSVKKKELQSQYKEREIVGGVFLIRNTANQKLLLDSSMDLQGSKNRFEFSRNTGSCVYLKLQKDWSEQGSSQFVFETLEELRKGETQTPAEFKADVALLKEMWQEKLSTQELY